MLLMTDQQAYAAMYYFLDKVYWATKIDDLGGMLGFMSLLEDGSTADAAVGDDWNRAIDFTLSNSEVSRPTSTRPVDADTPDGPAAKVDHAPGPTT